MDEVTKQTFAEQTLYYEDKMQEQHKEIEKLRKQLRAARSKERGYKKTIRKQKAELEKLKPEKQHFRNQTGAKKGVRR